MPNTTCSNPVILCILDGFGLGDKEYEYNAVFQSGIPNISNILETYPNSSIKTSGSAVGLPDGQMGNSEIGHMTIGAGRKIYRGLTKITQLLSDGKLFESNSIKIAEEHLRSCKGSKVHCLALVSDGGVHSHYLHLVQMIKHFCKLGHNVVIHLISDGRDVNYKSFKGFYTHFKSNFQKEELNKIEIATLSGRYYAMDRDNKTERTKQYIDAILQEGEQKHFSTIEEAIDESYKREIFDEFIEPCAVRTYEGINEQRDILITLNFRSDRMRQTMKSLALSKKFAHCISMVSYSDELAKTLNVAPIINEEIIQESLGEIIANAGLKQLRIAETEKFAHVTFFFSGGKEEKFTGEDRSLIPSPNVKTYEEKPEMSIGELEIDLFKHIKSKKYDLIILNIANPDMVGHTGNFEASMKAMEHVDQFVENLKNIAIDSEYNLLITADHGNIEEMIDRSTGEIHTQHTTGEVPFIFIPKDKSKEQYQVKNGSLTDIAPTILSIMEIKIPDDMSGKSLI